MPYEYNTLQVRKVTGGFEAKPIGGVTTDDLKIFANNVDAYPYLTLNGASYSDIHLSSTGAILRIYSDTEPYFYIDLSSAGETILQVKNAADNLYLKPAGAGLVKFGTYTGGAATDSTGYITILDALGNTRKLMVQA